MSGKRNNSAYGAARILFALALLTACASAQMNNGIMGPPANTRPPRLENVGIEQHLDAQVPADLTFRDETGKTVKLAPGGYHLMLLDLKGALKQGDKLPITLEFEKAGKVTVSFDVQGVGAAGPAKSGSQMDMKKMPDHSGMKM